MKFKFISSLLYLILLTQIAAGSEDKFTIFKNLALSEMGSSELMNLVFLKIENKINIHEFRIFFWGQERSKEALSKIADFIDKNETGFLQTLPKLDQTLIRSIVKDDISYDQITDEFKSDLILESPIQSQLLTEIVRIFNRDFNKIINDKIPFYKKIGINEIDDESANKKVSNIQLKLLTLLKLSYYQQILSHDDLISLENNAIENNQNIYSSFSFNYNIFLARCGSRSSSLNFNNSIEQSFGLRCSTETPTTVSLDLASAITNRWDFHSTDLLINSFVKGGYDSSHSENATGKLSYNLLGKITIPKCLNPSKCNQFVHFKIRPSTYFYPNSNLTYDNITLKINGQPISVVPSEDLIDGNETVIDISKQDAVVELSITGNKSHVGACCFKPAEYQSLNLSVNTTYNFQSEIISKTAAAAIVKAIVEDGYWFKEFSFIQYPLDLKLKIADTLKTRPNEYRLFFYPTLLFLRTILDGQLKDTMAITKITSLRDYISNEIGRKIILPAVVAQIGAYENAEVVKTKDEFNVLYQKILKITYIQYQSKDEFKNKLKDILLDQVEQNSEMKHAANNLIKNIDLALSMENIQNEINKYLTNIQFLNQKLLAEIKLLKREKELLEQK